MSANLAKTLMEMLSTKAETLSPIIYLKESKQNGCVQKENND